MGKVRRSYLNGSLKRHRAHLCVPPHPDGVVAQAHGLLVADYKERVGGFRHLNFVQFIPINVIFRGVIIMGLWSFSASPSPIIPNLFPRSSFLCTSFFSPKEKAICFWAQGVFHPDRLP